LSSIVDQQAPRFSICLPTFNRGHLLGGLFGNLARLVGPRFELVIVNDGSTDDTATHIARLAEAAPFSVTALTTSGAGLGAALNLALDHARGEFIVIMDDDDQLRPEALQRAETAWESIPPGERDQFCGICGLCADEDDVVFGSRFPSSRMDSDFFTMRVVHGVRGDKQEIVRRDAIGNYRVPVFPGERLGNASLYFFHAGRNLKARFVNEIWMTKGRLGDGLSARMRRAKMRSPNFHAEAQRQILEDHPRAPFLYRLKTAKDYLRYRAHAGEPMRAAAKRLSDHWLAWLAMPVAWGAVQGDRRRAGDMPKLDRH
jgi:glycosyltransferase involved in cell wall biosynthesis